MKRLIFLFIIILMIGIAMPGFAQTIHYLTEADIVWNAVTEQADGTPIPVGDLIEYEIYLEDSLGVQTLIGTTTALTFHVILPGIDTYKVGVGTKWTATGGGITYSGINWSDINGVYTPDPFLYRHPNLQQAPKLPEGLNTL